jgi:tripartite-type tricarboxylate transporter receptor subunit TctC
MPLAPAAFKARIESDRVRYAKVIKDGNVQID